MEITESFKAEIDDLTKRMSNLTLPSGPITTAESYAEAAGMLASIKAITKDAEVARKRLVEPHLAAQRMVNSQFREHVTDVLGKKEGQLKAALLAYQKEQERLAREAKAAAEERARKKRERLEKRAMAASEKGQHEKADQLAEESTTVVAPVVKADTPKVKGLRKTTKYDFEITNPELIPREYLTPDLIKIGKVVAALKDDAVIAGVKVTKTEGLASAS